LNKYILIGVKERRNLDFEASMQETERLMQAADLEVVFQFEQAMINNQPSYFKKGKLEEIKTAILNFEADGIVCNDALSPSQYRNLSEYLDTNVIDRTQLILEIFEKRAKQKESKLQVEVARLNYLLPRVKLNHHSAGREQGGGFKNKGAGEQALALKQRTMIRALQRAEAELASMDQQRLIQRTRRIKSDTLTIALVGYTNAGKSTLFNTLVKARAYAADQLFATLDTTTRQLYLGELGRVISLSDTVGFIRDLPHGLIDAFQATLQEAVDADLLLHVVDFSSPNYVEQIDEVQHVLAEIGAAGIPQVLVFNKIDRVAPEGRPAEMQDVYELDGQPVPRVFLSAQQGDGLVLLRALLANMLQQGQAPEMVDAFPCEP